MNNLLYFTADNGINGRELWVQSVCSSIQIATANFSTQQSNKYYYFDNASCSKLIAKVAPFINKATLANVSVWKETTQPSNFVKRHYEIVPATGSSISNATISLYFTQQEFNDFNAVNTIKLPGNSTDVANIANLYIVHHPGTSKNRTGLPDSYSSEVKWIKPDAKKVLWDAANYRWELSFTTSDFGGFTVQTRITPTQ